MGPRCRKLGVRTYVHMYVCVPMQCRHADGSQRRTPALLFYYTLPYYLEIVPLIKPAARLGASPRDFPISTPGSIRFMCVCT